MGSPRPTSPPHIAMLETDDNVTNEFTCMCSSIYQHCKGGRGSLEVTGNSLVAGRHPLTQTHLSQLVLSEILGSFMLVFTVESVNRMNP